VRATVLAVRADGSPDVVPAGRRFRSLAALVAVTLGVLSPAFAQQPALPAPMPQAAVAPPTRVFGSTTGLVLNFIKPDKTADFEAVMAKLKEALVKSANPVRNQQAGSWRVYKSAEPGPAGAVLYVYIVDPAVKDADYSVTTILSEAFSGDDLKALFKQYNEAYASGQNFVNLSLVPDLAR
jgi:hypothetical protein